MCVVNVTLFPGSTPLMCASIKGHVLVLKLLLECKANIDAKDDYGMILNSPTQFYLVRMCVVVTCLCGC